jgi:enoyl-CoA hydratase/carnithine racemase
MGLVAEVVPAADLMSAARRWAGEIMECSPASIRATKAVIRSYVNDGLEASNKTMFEIPAVKSLLTGPDAREGPKAFAEKRKPEWANPA